LRSCDRWSALGPELAFEDRFAFRRLCEQRRGRAAGCASMLALAARGVHGPACKPGRLVRRARVRRDSCPSALAPAMLGVAAPSQDSLRSLRSLRSTNCDESEHVARCARGPQALALQAAPGPRARPLARHKRSTGPLVSVLAFSAAHRRAAGCPPPPVPAWVWLFRRHATSGGPRGERCPVGAISGATRSAAPGSARAQRALHQLTRRICSNAANAVSVVSYAARPRCEHRSSALGARAARASTSDSRRLSERNERSE